ncbi:MAG TPA: YhfC family glutamic-type intramembrane protease [Anaerolineales bacterium]
MDILFFAHLLNGLLMIAMPVGLAIFLTARWKLGARLWLIGAATFILSQVGHIPFNALAGLVLNRTGLAKMTPEAQLIFNAVFLGLSAGLFEEFFRYGMFRWWAKDARSWRKGVLAGAGHGGAEAIILGAIVLYAFVQLVYLRNADISKVVPAAQLALTQQQVSAYWSMSWYASLLGALERLFTIPTQIALAVLVLQTFTRKQWFWVWLAVLYHAALDAGAVWLSVHGGSLPTEVLAGAFALISLLLILLLHQPEPPEENLPPPIPPAPVFVPKPLEATPDKLDQTRYA